MKVALRHECLKLAAAAFEDRFPGIDAEILYTKAERLAGRIEHTIDDHLDEFGETLEETRE